MRWGDGITFAPAINLQRAYRPIYCAFLLHRCRTTRREVVRERRYKVVRFWERDRGRVSRITHKRITREACACARHWRDLKKDRSVAPHHSTHVIGCLLARGRRRSARIVSVTDARVDRVGQLSIDGSTHVHEDPVSA
jgi:hypothetical protein